MALSSDTKIDWDKLAISLQNKIKALETKAQSNIDKAKSDQPTISANTTAIQANADKIVALKTKIESAFEAMSDKVNNIKIPSASGGDEIYDLMQGEIGQIAKLDSDNHKLIPQDGCLVRMMCTDKDLGYLSKRHRTILEMGTRLDDARVYDIENKCTYAWNGSDWATVDIDQANELENRTFYISPINWQLYYYYRKGWYGTLSPLSWDNVTTGHGDHIDKNDIGHIREVGNNYGSPYVAAIGDSCVDVYTLEGQEAANGVDATRYDHWGVIFEEEIHCNFYNIAVSGEVMLERAGAGDTFGPSTIYNRFYSQIMKLNPLPEYLLFDGGGNDTYLNPDYTADAIYRCYKNIIATCNSNNIVPIILIFPSTWTDGYLSEDSIKKWWEIQSAIVNYCKDHGILCINCYNTEIFDWDNGDVNREYMAPDCIHLGYSGNRVAGEYIAQFFKDHHLG